MHKKFQLLIAHQDEVEQQLAAPFSKRAPERIGNNYLVIGTLDRDVWKRGVAEPLAIQEMVEQLHDFVECWSCGEPEYKALLMCQGNPIAREEHIVLVPYQGVDIQ